ncbi:hypothetical protein DDT91_09345 [Algoriphagus sp. AK58]|nr:hypothetical protein [Algoriphagus sp. AK58]
MWSGSLESAFDTATNDGFLFILQLLSIRNLILELDKANTIHHLILNNKLLKHFFFRSFGLIQKIQKVKIGQKREFLSQ